MAQSSPIVALLLASSLWSGAAYAQGAATLPSDQAASGVPAPDVDAAATGAGDLGDIVVTARRTAERQQTVPIAITAFTQRDLTERRIVTATDLQNFTPSLNVAGSLGRNDESLTLRGIGATNSSVGGGPGVVAYLAETPFTASGPGLFFDLQSLQVLKGPQGTLFGRNTTGGAVLLEPARPSLTSTEGYGSFTLGNYAERMGEGAVSVPLINGKLGLRIAGRFERQKGSTYDVNLRTRLNNRNNISLRGGLLFEPVDGISSYTLVEYVRVNERAAGSILTLVNPNGPSAAATLPLLAAQQARGPRRSAVGVFPIQLNKTLFAANNTSIDLGETLTFKNIVSLTRRWANNALDGDGTVLQINDLLGADPGGYSANNRTITEEARLQLHDVGMMTAQAGVYYERTKDTGSRTFSLIAANGNFRSRQLDARNGSRSVGVFAQATADFGQGLKLTGGYRQTWDRFTQQIAIQLAGTPICLTGGGPAPNCPLTPELVGKSDGPSWTANLSWQRDPATLLFATLSRGYKSGGFNDAIGGQVGTDSPFFAYQPEKVTAAEVGVKRDWDLGGSARARTNASLFYNWYNNIQRNDNALVGTVPNQFISTVTTNAAKASIKGFEFEGTLAPMPGLNLNLGYSYLDSNYSRYIDPLGVDKSGLPFQYTPKHKVVIEGQVKLPVPDTAADTRLRASYSYQSRVQVAPDIQPQGTIAPYGLLNARITFDAIGGAPLSLAVFATNLTNRTYAVASNANYNSTGLVTRVFGDPRLYGVTAGFKF